MATMTYAPLVNQKSTTLAGAITASVPANGGTLNVTDGTVFPAKGYLLIDQELFHYDSVAANALALNATDGRASGGTTAATHNNLAAVYADVIVAAHFNELVTNSPNTLMTAKGDLITASAANAPVRLGVGSDGQLLSASSTAAGGLAYIAAGSVGPFPPIQDISVASPTSVLNFTSIPATYKHLSLVVSARGASSVESEDMALQLSADTGNNYDSLTCDIKHSASVQTSTYMNASLGYLAPIPGASASTSLFGGLLVSLPGYAGSSLNKGYHAEGNYHTGVASGKQHIALAGGVWNSTGVVNALKLLLPSGNNFAAGTRATLYGEG